MTKLKTVFLLILIFLLNSCKEESFKLDTETYKIEIKKASSSTNRDFTNKIQTSPLNINAERISLKDILGILIETDTSNIKFENESFQSEYYSVLLEQKKAIHSVNEVVLNDILNNWNLKLHENKLYEIKVQDTLMFSNFISNSNNMDSKIIKSKDSIKVSNCDLKSLAEVLNSEFSERVISNDVSKKIDFSWEKTTFDKLKLQLQNDLGIMFLDSKIDKTTYIISNN